MTTTGRLVGAWDRPLLELAAFPALMLFIFTIPWEDSVVLPGVGTIARFAGLVAVGIGVLSVLRRDGVSLRRPAAFLLPFALFAIWTVTSLIWAPVRTAGVEYGGTIVQLFVMCWLLWQLCRTARQRASLMQAYVLGSYVSVAATILQFLSGNTFAGSAQERFAAAGFNPNYLASTLALAIPMAWLLVISGRSRWLAIVNFIAIPAIVVAIFLTGSRGGLITAALALTVIPLTYARLGPRTQITVVIGLFAMGFAAYWLAPAFEDQLPSGIQRFAEIPQQLQSGDLTGRGNIWSAGIELFRDNHVIGVGAGGFSTSVELYLGEARSAHNAFINVAAQGGFIGLLLFTATLGLVAVPFVLDLRGDRIVYLVLLATVMLCLLPSTLENGKQVWFALSLAASHSTFVLGRNLVSGQRLRSAAAAFPDPVVGQRLHR